LMFFQSFNIPMPSEITMPFSGFLASQGIFNFWTVVFVGAVGNLGGAFLSYKFAKFFVKNGLRDKYKIAKILISDSNLKIAENWFEKYGGISVFFGRMVPVVSTFISFPAGLAKMPLKSFLLFSFLGSFIWCFILTKIGFVLGHNWNSIEIYFRKFDYLILAAIIVALVFWLYRHLKNR
ncbi:DedA family protein, partial [Candidatus Wolfebacteria bacterium]|nr:DedA family protein [Candidatus Wolfebacteria bacterium]